ncbi:hypothetical protein [Chengkuizengella axinellae]|uniref:DUF1436 family protein n=1 Tax=Chengkuizengella axinellae TaxID=3064388 RepID=A0ABT9IWV3_9BACL|nr:hypothetical protein [Chengkuizengella sp. 2205SS18-9]MDP5273849.1 hypothetical protein [Chengkuizengella sp. 2205SS18-9]
MKEYTAISIFKNVSDDSMFMFPMGKNKIGAGTAINKPIIMNDDYTSKDIGVSLKKCIDVIINKKYTEEDKGLPVPELVTGIKSNWKFTRLYILTRVTLYPSEGFEITSTKREKNAYSWYEDTPQLKLNIDATKGELGEGVLKMFELCE